MMVTCSSRLSASHQRRSSTLALHPRARSFIAGDGILYAPLSCNHTSMYQKATPQVVKVSRLVKQRCLADDGEQRIDSLLSRLQNMKAAGKMPSVSTTPSSPLNKQHNGSQGNDNAVGGDEVGHGNGVPQHCAEQKSANKPVAAVIRQLLIYLTNADEISKLKCSNTPPVPSSAILRQDMINKLAIQLTPSHLAESSTDVTQAMESYRAASDRLPITQKRFLLTKPTSMPAQPQLVPLLYYAVASGSRELVSFLLDQGANPNAAPALATGQRSSCSKWQKVPPIALAIAQRDHEMLLLLLQRGANPLAIPSVLYLPSMQKEGLHAVPKPDAAAEDEATAWCSSTEDYQVLAECLNPEVGCGLLMQYWLTRALKLPPLTNMCHSVAVAGGNKLQRVPELRLGVIGQENACSLLYHLIMTHCGMSDKERHKRSPLVVLLAGPSGHGKTLLGQMMQTLLPGARYHFEDCSKLHHVIDLWGASGPFQHSERRPGFAECLFVNSGKPSVIVLDEFEKMRSEVQNSLLSVMQDGKFTDAFSQTEVDCSQTVFLLTTNAADRHIVDYWSLHRDRLLNLTQRPATVRRELDPLIRQFSHISRLTGVVPFLPFTETEQMMVVQQALLDTAAGLSKAPDPANGRAHGSITVELKDQTQVCRALARDTYHEDEGARAVVNGIYQLVDMEIKTALLEEELCNGGTVELTASREQTAPYELYYSDRSH